MKKVLIVSFRKYFSEFSLQKYAILETTSSVSTHTLMGYLLSRKSKHFELKHLELFYIWPGSIINEREIYSRVNDYSPDVIAVSLLSVDYEVYKNFYECIHRVMPRTIWIGGGYLPTGYPAIIKESGLDYLILSHGEIPLYLLLEHIATGNYPLHTIPNLVFKKNDGNLQINKIEIFPKEEQKVRLSFEPFNANYYIKESWQIPPVSEMVYLTTWFSRGCPHNCGFCLNRKMNYGKMLIRPYKIVINEIIKMNEKYNVNYIFFADEDFLLYKNKVKKLLQEMIKVKLPQKVHFTFMTNVNKIAEEENTDFIPLLKEAGCEEIQYGIESGSQKILDRMNKKIVLENIVRAFSLTSKNGIFTAAMLVLGYEGETLKSLEKTYKFLHQLKPDRLSLFFCVPFQGTEVFPYFEKDLKNVPLFFYNSDFPIAPVKSIEEELTYKVDYQLDPYLKTIFNHYGFKLSNSQKYLMRFREKLMYDYHTSPQFREQEKNIFDKRLKTYKENKQILTKSAKEWFKILEKSINKKGYREEMLKSILGEDKK